MLSNTYNIASIIGENRERNKRLHTRRDPLSGSGCDTVPRKEISIRGLFGPKRLYLPEEMFEKSILLQDLIKHKTLAKYLKRHKKPNTEENIISLNLLFAEERRLYDVEYYFYSSTPINPKEGGSPIRFILNHGQAKLVREYERQRLLGIPIRVILDKARQWGGSTSTQLYFSWIQLCLKVGVNSVICTHLLDAAKNIRAMYDLVTQDYPTLGEVVRLEGFQGAQSIREIKSRNCRITVGTAESPNSVRSQNVSLAHFSEVAFFPTTPKMTPEKLIGSVTGSIIRAPLTMIVYESTAKGIGNFFHRLFLEAIEGNSAFVAVFVAWYEIGDGYYEESVSDYEAFVASWDDYEWQLWRMGASIEQIRWYRSKLSEMPDRMSMFEEYPSTWQESFQSSGTPVFKASLVERLREGCFEPIYKGDIYGKKTSAEARLNPHLYKEVLEELHLIESPHGALKIWAYPPQKDEYTDRYVVAVDTGGAYKTSDYTSIRVFDRLPMMYGAGPEVVAHWWGHADHHTITWQAARIAKWYHNALLVFESNTAEMEKKAEGAPTEYIYDTLAGEYRNLYSRTPSDKIIQGAPAKWGFQTNRLTKTMIKDTFVEILAMGDEGGEIGYVERDVTCVDEARTFEYKENGSFGAIDGNHDDVIMATMIGIYICYSIPFPKKRGGGKIRGRVVVGDSTF